ncbi:hypothetical protein ACFFJT_19130 [Dyella flava]|uniref:Uncharacterized protein n=1 Tax=Dyella flava TaxID=1920170 RepID=A0ABS2K900_9GAMM|nr:hypothetical protein [Dyella flava]MBM7127195.1 hypothetical protein [Dyella flava]
MLAGASRFIAARAGAVSLFAHTEASLLSLRQGLPDALEVATTAVDYRSQQAFSAAIRSSVKKFGVPEMVLAWVHTEAPALALAAQLAAYGQPVQFFHVLGSASASPSASLVQQRRYYDALPELAYHQIVLGFVADEQGSRWLHNDEIVNGVIDAVRENAACHVVGTVEPWHARP